MNQPEISELLDKTYSRWQGSLMDLGGRNQLVNFHDFSASTFSTNTTPTVVSKGSARYLDVISGLDAIEREAALKRISKMAKIHLSSLEERGVSTLKAASQLVSWESSGKSYRTPVVLQDLTSTPAAARFATPLSLELVEDTVALNPNLLPLLRDVLRIPSAQAWVEEATEQLGSSAEGSGWPCLELGRTLAKSLVALLAGAGVTASSEDVTVVSNFNYSRLPMVQDLHNARSAGVSNLLVTALAGDVGAKTALSASGAAVVDPSFPNRIPAADESLVLDADSSQSVAISRVQGGQSIVIQGPPGTGKSQTISNLVASLIAEGKSVLFVAEKKAAVEAVTARLSAVGLDHLIFELHGKTSDKKWVYAELEAAFSSMNSVLPAATPPASFEASRNSLQAAVETLHAPLAPWGLSPYSVMASVLALRPKVSVRLPRLGPSMGRILTSESLESKVGMVSELAAMGGFDARLRSSLWFGLRSQLPQAPTRASDALGWASNYLRTEWAKLEAATNGPASSLEDLQHQFQASAALARAAVALTPALLGSGDVPTLALLESGSKLDASGAKLGWLARRRVRKGGRQRAQAGLPTASYASALADAARLDSWRAARWGAVLPHPEVIALQGSLDQLSQVLNDLAELFPSVDWRTSSLEVVLDHVASLEAQEMELSTRMPKLHASEQAVNAAGLAALMPVLLECQATEATAADIARLALATSMEEAMRLQHPGLAELNADQLDGKAGTFRLEDANHISNKAQAISRVAAFRLKEALDANPTGHQMLKDSFVKVRNKPSLRRLAEEHFSLLLAAQPCWTMSPLEVCQVLPLSAHFDVVIFDEASQVQPHEAVPALLRASQAVIAGDRHQLPPTTFFATEVDADEAAESKDYDSLLDAVSPYLRNCLLSWHYRSQDERLIAVSNQEIYANNLVTFPGAGGVDAIEFHQVSAHPGSNAEQSSSDEIAKVVDLALAHARTEPDQSLGVITFNLKHADRIQAALDQASLGDAPLAALMRREREPLFVKNIERVQGDERDTIIISTGYTKDIHGRLPQRFGPINQEGGERRLNVVASRAKRRMVLVSCFDSSDISAVSERRGVQVLRAFFDFMERGGVLVRSGVSDIPLNAFELDIRDKLAARGLDLVPQYGCSGYRIDFAILHPSKPGEFVLAVEADGASYHSLPTARDRDRLRQEHLERLGWRFHRIWSTAWFRNSEAEVEKVWAAYQGALSGKGHQRHQASVPDLPLPDLATFSERPFQFPASPGLKIDQYSDQVLDQVARWVLSDMRLRTISDLAEEMRLQLGFRYRGSKIQARLTTAAERMSA